ncbi:MAG TPA: flippase activity-associated protein Agl23 [Solirubrobacteraceae bacterium]|nr:flippase activity-associated protein Agl23 [Solirubrobacteraceae bacterium]
MRLRRPSNELIAYGVLVAIALGLRLYDLGSRPFHHDESQDAYFSWILSTKGDYAYNPLLHGPLRFYLTASMYTLFGDSDFTARLAPALMGTAMVAMPYFLRRQLGHVAAFTAAVLLAIGPSYLYFSRFAREDIYFAAISFALLVVVFRFLDEPRRWHPALIGALIAAGFATKETMYITGFVAFTFFVLLFLRERSGDERAARGSGRGGETLATIRSVGWDAWVWALASFAAVFTLLFTVFLTNPAGLWDGLYESLHYWLGQHEVGRGGEKPYFYVVVLFAHEWPVLLLGGVGAVLAFRQPTVFRAFLVWAFALSLGIYSWAGEKFAWLVLHPLLPLILLAGIGVQWMWENRGTALGRGGLAVAAVIALYVPLASWWANVEHRADPREFLVSTQSSEDVKRVADQVVAMARKQPKLTVTVDSADGATFPYAWYFRDLNVGYLDLSTTDAPPPSDVLVVTERSRERLAPNLGGYEGRRFPFRVWWVREYGQQSVGNWLRWFTRREPWNPTGGLPEWLFTRRDISVSAAGRQG